MTQIFKQPNGNLICSGTCIFTGQRYETQEFTQKEYDDWQNGTLVQNAFPKLSADDREFLISGTSPAGWAEIFEGKED